MIALEVCVRHLSREVHDSTKKLDEMHDVLMQAKGAKWVLLATAGLGGFFAGTLPKLWPFLTGR